jgi:hypothetical protein
VPPGGDDHTHDIDSAPDSAIDTDQHDTADGDRLRQPPARHTRSDLTAFTTLVVRHRRLTDRRPVDVTWPDDDLEDDDLDHDPPPPLSRLLDFLFTTSYAETTAALHRRRPAPRRPRRGPRAALPWRPDGIGASPRQRGAGSRSSRPPASVTTSATATTSSSA